MKITVTIKVEPDMLKEDPDESAETEFAVRTEIREPHHALHFATECLKPALNSVNDSMNKKILEALRAKSKEATAEADGS